jgi:excisionase family DNA binding protein
MDVQNNRIAGSQKSKRTKRTAKEQLSNTWGTPPSHIQAMKLLTVKEAADLLKVKPQWVYGMLHGSGLPFIRLGRQIRIDEDALEQWLTSLRTMA